MLPYGGLQAGPMVHVNKDIDRHWRDIWDLKEKALRTSYMKSVEKLERHSKLQQPLYIGDKVCIQNQTGRFATKWEKTGRIIETHANDQYTVKVDGSGRMTLRNRQFLRKVSEHTLFGKPQVSTDAMPDDRQSTRLYLTQQTPSEHHTVSTPLPATQYQDSDVINTPVKPVHVNNYTLAPADIHPWKRLHQPCH